ncbi:hypothetical protein M407DRAFT_27635 [Tulasnella calospora MUT 4182]|uniref:GLTSCR protein conserved domain-containing protein n=1 Tax=Tulasnella calospora MUT 4182 TaxID=1051891 RepID=A0A0C3QC38_9AGAM|nr:hypothetical protein M407DRAFT_27635 [Tulasnella calospora MUT 4182]
MADAKQNEISQPFVFPNHSQNGRSSQSQENSSHLTHSHAQSANGNGTTPITASGPRKSSIAKAQQVDSTLKSSNANGTSSTTAPPPTPGPSGFTAAFPGSNGTAPLPLGQVLSTLVPGSSVALAEKERRREEEAAYLLSRKRLKTKEDQELQLATRNAFAQLLATDHRAVDSPDVETPFRDAVDVVRRLLPYHVFQHHQEELEYATALNNRALSAKGKGKATDVAALPPHLQTSFALELHKEARALKERFRQVRTREGAKTSPDDQMYWLTQAVLESERELNTRLTSQLREAQAEKDRQERLKRGIPTTPSSATTPYQHAAYSYPAYPPPPTPTAAGMSYPNYAAYATNPAYQAYYQQYAAAMSSMRVPYAVPYPYGSYGYLHPGAAGVPPSYPAHPAVASPSGTLSTAGSLTALSTPLASTPVFPTTPAPYAPPNSALPLSIPTSALESLRAIDIIPVPLGSIAPGTTPQPPVVLLSTSPDGSNLVKPVTTTS